MKFGKNWLKIISVSSQCNYKRKLLLLLLSRLQKKKKRRKDKRRRNEHRNLWSCRILEGEKGEMRSRVRSTRYTISVVSINRVQGVIGGTLGKSQKSWCWWSCANHSAACPESETRSHIRSHLILSYLVWSHLISSCKRKSREIKGRKTKKPKTQKPQFCANHSAAYPGFHPNQKITWLPLISSFFFSKKGVKPPHDLTPPFFLLYLTF